MSEINENDGEPQLTEGTHIASNHDDERRASVAENASDTPLSSITNTAGVDEPEPSLRDPEELDESSSKKVHETGSSNTTLRENSRSDTIDWLLPDESDDGGRTGIHSTHTEVHALVLGITAGAHVSLSGETQLVNDIVGITLAGDRARRANAIPEKYRDQAKQELPYFMVGMAVGYGITRADVLATIG